MHLEAAILGYYPADEMTGEEIAEDLVRRVREMWDGIIDVEVGTVDGTSENYTVRVSSGVVGGRTRTGLKVCDVLVVTRDDGSTVIVGPFDSREDWETWMWEMGLYEGGRLAERGWKASRMLLFHPTWKQSIDYLHDEGG